MPTSASSLGVSSAAAVLPGTPSAVSQSMANTMIPVVFVTDIHDKMQVKPFIDYIAQMQFKANQILPFVDEPARRKLTRFVTYLIEEGVGIYSIYISIPFCTLAYY